LPLQKKHKQGPLKAQQYEASLKSRRFGGPYSLHACCCPCMPLQAQALVLEKKTQARDTCKKAQQ